jgi:hypothetical protein
MVIKITFTALALALVLYLQLAVDLPKWIETATRTAQERSVSRG